MSRQTIRKTVAGKSSEGEGTPRRYAPAFFALATTRVTDAIIADGSEVAVKLGIKVPARSMSTLLSLLDAPKGVTELARELGVTHVAVIKISKSLIEQGYIRAGRDPSDARRRPLELTDKGRDAATGVQWFMTVLRDTYIELFDEIGVNADRVIGLMEDALSRRSFFDRLDAKSQDHIGR